MLWAVTNNSRDTSGRLVAVDTGWIWNVTGRVRGNAWVIVIKNKRLRVVRIYFTTYPRIARAQVTIWYIDRKLFFFLRNGRATPRSVLTMSSNNDPFFT